MGVPYMGVGWLVIIVDEGISQLRGPGILWMQAVWIQRLDVRRCWMSLGNQGILVKVMNSYWWA